MTDRLCKNVNDVRMLAMDTKWLFRLCRSIAWNLSINSSIRDRDICTDWGERSFRCEANKEQFPPLDICSWSLPNSDSGWESNPITVAWQEDHEYIYPWFTLEIPIQHAVRATGIGVPKLNHLCRRVEKFLSLASELAWKDYKYCRMHGSRYWDELKLRHPPAISECKFDVFDVLGGWIGGGARNSCQPTTGDYLGVEIFRTDQYWGHYKSYLQLRWFAIPSDQVYREMNAKHQWEGEVLLDKNRGEAPPRDPTGSELSLNSAGL